MSKFELSTYFLLGGGRSDMKGFIGCLKNVKIQESTLTMDSKGTVKLFFITSGIQIVRFLKSLFLHSAVYLLNSSYLLASGCHQILQ